MEVQSSASLLPRAWDVPEVFRRRLGANVGRQRAMEHEGHLLLVLHAPPLPDESERQGRLFWRNPEGQWRSTEQGAGLASLQTHVSEYADQVSQLDTREQQAANTEQYFEVINQLAPLLRASRNLHNVLQTARKMFPEERSLIDLRDQAYAIERNAELLSADTHTSLDFAVAKQNEQQSLAAHKMAVSSHRLNVLAAIFFPMATLSALFGVNLQHTLEKTSPPWPFLILAAIGLAMGLALVAYVVRPPRK